MRTDTAKWTKALLAATLAVLLAFAAKSAHGYHDTLTVYVNGQLLTPQQIHYVEQVTGLRFQSGYYWYDAPSGYWGIVNGPVIGRVAPQGYQPGYQSGYQGGPGTWSQGSTVTEAYPNGGAASGNSNTGIGVITDGQGGAFISQ